MALRRKVGNRLRRAVNGGLSRLHKPAHHDPTPEERAASTEPALAIPDHEPGSHRLNPQSWQLPAGLAEAGETEERGLRPGPLVMTIIICAALFILLIAVLAAHMTQPAQ